MFDRSCRPSAALQGYHGLPRVSFWSVWHERTTGPDLARRRPFPPRHSPVLYASARLARGRHALPRSRTRTRYGRSKLAPRGYRLAAVSPADFGGMRHAKLLMRALTGRIAASKPVRGSARPTARGCPASGVRVRSAPQPSLFTREAFAISLSPGTALRTSVTRASPTSPTFRRVGTWSGPDRATRIWGRAPSSTYKHGTVPDAPGAADADSHNQRRRPVRDTGPRTSPGANPRWTSYIALTASPTPRRAISPA